MTDEQSDVDVNSVENTNDGSNNDEGTAAENTEQPITTVDNSSNGVCTDAYGGVDALGQFMYLCNDVSCRLDTDCLSSMCRSLKCADACLQAAESDFHRCNEEECTENSQCRSGICINSVCKAECAYNLFSTDGEIDRNRCDLDECSADSQCLNLECRDGQCGNEYLCNISGLALTNRCEGVICFRNDQCHSG